MAKAVGAKFKTAVPKKAVRALGPNMGKKNVSQGRVK